MSLLSVSDLNVSYRIQSGDVPAVRGVSFDIDKGEVLGLAGESGCGKSTIAGAIMRLLPESTKVTGQVMLNGDDVLLMKPGKLRAVRWTEARQTGLGLLPEQVNLDGTPGWVLPLAWSHAMLLLAVRPELAAISARRGRVAAAA